jgi:hypothetical protein
MPPPAITAEKLAESYPVNITTSWPKDTKAEIKLSASPPKDVSTKDGLENTLTVLAEANVVKPRKEKLIKYPTNNFFFHLFLPRLYLIN